MTHIIVVKMESKSFVRALTSVNDVIEPLSWESKSPAEFLRSFSHGAYTCLRLQENSDPTKLIEFHFGRLQQSVALLFSRELSQSFNRKTLQTLLDHLVGAQDLKSCRSAFVTILVLPADTGIKLLGHAIGPSIPSTRKVDLVLVSTLVDR